jgi:hypothetical protein
LLLQEFTAGWLLHIRQNETFSLFLRNVKLFFTCFYAAMGFTRVPKIRRFSGCGQQWQALLPTAGMVVFKSG